MNFRSKLQYLLVHSLLISNKEAATLIAQGRIRVNDSLPDENIILEETDNVYIDDQLVRKGKVYTYLLYHKPRGIECTLNASIADGLHSVLQLDADMFHIGRLDKESEGLLLLSNDGSLGKSLLDKEKGAVKVYEVETDKPVTRDFLSFLEKGVTIMGKITLECRTKQVDDKTFEIQLTEGMNRQIRRMCYKAGYEVKRLLRKEFAGIALDVKAGQSRMLTRTEIVHLRSF